VLIAATSGVSAIVLPDGRIQSRTAEFTQEVLLADVPLRDARTLADRIGPWSERLLALGAVVALLLALAERRGRGRRAGAGAIMAPGDFPEQEAAQR
jgi:apolipoprotein N-acyltransferase